MNSVPIRSNMLTSRADDIIQRVLMVIFTLPDSIRLTLERSISQRYDNDRLTERVDIDKERNIGVKSDEIPLYVMDVDSY